VLFYITAFPCPFLAKGRSLKAFAVRGEGGLSSADILQVGRGGGSSNADVRTFLR